jgi:hypothetical protein
VACICLKSHGSKEEEPGCILYAYPEVESAARYRLPIPAFESAALLPSRIPQLTSGTCWVHIWQVDVQAADRGATGK